MVIYDTHQKIDALKEMLPGGFVFVLDTTDRSFVYKSTISPNCEQKVIALDKVHGIDRLTKTSNQFAHNDVDGLIKIHRIGQNTYIGFCAPSGKYSESQTESADRLLNDLN